VQAELSDIINYKKIKIYYIFTELKLYYLFSYTILYIYIYILN